MSTAPGSVPSLPRAAFVEQVMGLPVSVHVRGPSPRSSEVLRAVSAVFAALRATDRQFSTYRADSEVSRFAAGLISSPSAVLAEVLSLCELARERTGGAFDADLPDGWDPSGLVKGWAVERAAEPLRQLDDHDWLVNAGGDVLLHATDGRFWTVGVQDPADPSRILRAIPADRGAVATSGTTHRGPHLIDPATGRPATAVRSATVVGPRLLWADVYATAAFVKGAAGQEWLDECAARDGYWGFVVA